MRACLCALVIMLSACTSNVAPPPEAEGAQDDGFWWWNSGYTETKYPIVLIHGFMGFDSIFGIIDYWPGIVSALESDGATVYVTTSSAANSSEVRGEILIERLEEIKAATGAQKFNLIGHSQGGLDGRYIAAVRPDLVASHTSIAGPHKGSGLGSLNGGSAGGSAQELITDAIELIAKGIRAIGGAAGPIDVEAAIHGLTEEGLNEFNANYPAALPDDCGEGEHEVNGIRYYSWSGTGTLTNALDPLDAAWGLTSLLIEGADDGLVDRCSSHLGDVIRDNYFQNHLDEVNLMFGLVSPFTVNPRTLFRIHANRLKNAGL